MVGTHRMHPRGENNVGTWRAAPENVRAKNFALTFFISIVGMPSFSNNPNKMQIPMVMPVLFTTFVR